MPQSLSSVLIHLVFSTKNRESFISPAVEAELHRYMATIFRDHDSPSLIIDGTTDHVHMLFALGRTITIAEVVEEVKTGSSKWLKTRPRVQEFSLAERIRCVFNWPIECGRVETLHSKPKGASSPGCV